MAESSIDFTAVILAGGSGERFWPLSTAKRPKQFLSVFGGESLLRQSVKRLKGLVNRNDIAVITAKALVSATIKELPEIPNANIVGEPMRRDTAAAIALATGMSKKRVMGVFPSDQLVGNPKKFQSILRKAIKVATKTHTIVTLGIKPTYPATTFGYINPKTGKFVEKPDVATAKKYIRKGYLWNAGMFIGEAEVFKAAFAQFAPALLPLATARPKALSSIYAKLPKISFDFAVMEKLPKVSVVESDFGWDDVGGYLAYDRYYKHDSSGNVIDGSIKAVETTNSICVSKGAEIRLLGVKDLIVVSTKDSVLVAHKSQASELKKLFK